MSMTTPRVSVVMPVHNALPYLKEAVDSLLTQTFADIEIVALDDQLTDGSGEFLQSITDPRMRAVRCGKQGVARLRKEGLNLARGQYYAAMDADDVSLPWRIERQVAFMDKNPEIVACGSQAIVIDGAGNEPAAAWVPAGPRRNIRRACYRALPDLATRYDHPHATPAGRRRVQLCA